MIKKAPVYAPDEEVDFNLFASQKNELKKIVFNENAKPVGNEYVNFPGVNMKYIGIVGRYAFLYHFLTKAYGL